MQVHSFQSGLKGSPPGWPELPEPSAAAWNPTSSLLPSLLVTQRSLLSLNLKDLSAFSVSFLFILQ